MYGIRWHIANSLVRLAFRIAPRGPARDRFLAAIEAENAFIIRAFVRDRTGEK